MPASRAAVPLLTLVGLVAALAALVLVGSQASVRASSTGEEFPCLATWDIVLNHASNDPDGSPGLPGEDISGQCQDEAHRNFDIAIALAIGGVVLVSTAIVLAGRRRRRHEVIRAEQTDAPSG